MAMDPNSQWFLNWNGTSRGPYTLDQLRAFHKAGQIRSEHQVSAPHLNGKWITVAEALSTPTSGLASFHPPPRPSDEITRSILRPEDMDSPRGTDPTLSLFDALQAARERKPLSKTEIAGESVSGVTESRSGIPPQIWLIGSIALIVGTLIWGTFQLMQHSAKLLPIAAPPAITQTAPVPVAPPKKPTFTFSEPAHTPKPKTALSSFGKSTVDRSKELEKEREKEREREREREKEREYRERDREYEKERERDVYDRERDTDKNGGAENPSTLRPAPQAAGPPGSAAAGAAGSDAEPAGDFIRTKDGVNVSPGHGQPASTGSE